MEQQDVPRCEAQRTVSKLYEIATVQMSLHKPGVRMLVRLLQKMRDLMGKNVGQQLGDGFGRGFNTVIEYTEVNAFKRR